MASTEKGTVRWKIEDDQGRTHEIQTEAILNKKLPHKLWSPQHWAQHIGDKQGTTCTITGTSVTISSARLNFTKTITLEPASNVAIIRTAPGFRKYAKFAAKHDATQHMKTFPAVIPYNEGEVDVNRLPLEAESVLEIQQPIQPQAGKGIDQHTPTQTPNVIEFGDEIPQHETEEEELLDPQQELLRWHMRLGHLPFGKLQQLATQNVIPKRLSECRVPLCTGCLYGKAT